MSVLSHHHFCCSMFCSFVRPLCCTFLRCFVIQLCSLILVASTLLAQFPDIKFERVTSSDGVSLEGILCMAQDRYGFMWIGTETGLIRYDGYSFRTYKHNPRDSTTISGNAVFHLYEDQRGRLWVATWNGLNLYSKETDSFRHLRSDGTISPSQSYLDAGTICEDKRGNYWIGTTKGLLRWNEESGKTAWYRHDPHDSTSISQHDVVSVLVDRSGTLWAGTRNGLNKYDSVNDRFTRYMHDKNRDSSTYSFNVCLFEDSRGTIWFSHQSGGVWRYDRQENRFERFVHDPSDPNSPLAAIITAINEDQHGRVWVWHISGIDIFDAAAGVFRHALPNAGDPTPIDGFSFLFRDKAGGMWRTYNGLERYDPNRQKFMLYRNFPNARNSLGGNAVTSVVEDKSGIAWIGTHGGGLDRLDRRTNTFTHYRHNGSNPNSIGSDYINAVYEDRRGNVWIAFNARNGGTLDLFDRKTNTFTHYPYRNVKTIFEDSDGDLWLGLNNERSDLPDLIRLDSDRKFAETLNIQGNGVVNIYQDHAGYLWMGSPFWWVTRYDKKTGSSTCFDMHTNTAIGNVRATYEDSAGILWFATRDAGLLRYDRKANTLTPILENDGLPSNFVNGLLPDDKGNIWISTGRGLSRYNPRAKTFRNFTPDDGLQGVYFNDGSCFKGKNGWLYFGGTNGLNVFHPDSIKDNPNIPPVVITSFKIFDQEQRPGGLGDVKEIQLSYNQNHFSFEFVALDYTDPKRNQYAYKMEGVDEDWVHSGTRRFASYTNLDPGAYTFRVKGSNNDGVPARRSAFRRAGVWNEAGTSLTLIITPPWWRTAWAYTVYVALFGSALFGIRRFEKNRERMKFQMEMKHREAEKLKEVDQMKSRFFANISHEFRTPLTLILGPIEKWSGRTGEGEMGRDLSMMRRNAQRLLRLINQLLDLSKIEAGGMKLQASPGNIVPFAKGIANSFESSAGRRKISLNVEAESDEIELYFDRDKIEKILSNLLSNAFKFTPEGGEVTVSIDREKGRRGDEERGRIGEGDPTHSKEQSVQVTVRDTGIGIPSDELDKVFDRFYQVDASQTREHARLPDGQEGSGIGLALTKELVELHRGTIEVKSEVGKGSEFIIRLPLGRDHLKDEEIIETVESRIGETEKRRMGEITDSPVHLRKESFGPFSSERSPSDDSSPQRVSASPSSNNIKQLTSETDDQPTSPLVLIIEDNADVCAYIGSYLIPIYRVIESRDGVEGVEKAKETIPDLIISDLMMPKMDGYEVCKQLKHDVKTSHIPIILLTAKAGREDKIEGLETGADDYLVKPFDAKELLARVKNLIELRRKLRERFSAVPTGRQAGQVLKPGDVAVKSLDDVFLQKVIAAVEARMGDEHFSVDDLAKDASMSRYQLHRKLTALTNMAAGDFIRYMRLQRGRDLLEKNAGTVSEIAYTVGFGSVPYFTKCFREQFGVTPSELKGKESSHEL